MRTTKIFVLLVSILVLSLNVNGAMIANESDRGFEGGDPGGNGLESGSSLIGQYIVEGGGHYLNSYSAVLMLLNKVEMSEMYGLNYPEAQELLNTAIHRLENAGTAYFNLKNLAAVTPYDQTIIEILRHFDYRGFQKEKGLDPFIFKKVEKDLRRGNIRGVYNRLYDDVCVILEQLYGIKESLDNNRFPEISRLWRINQNFSTSISYGQGVAEVFYKIKEVI